MNSPLGFNRRSIILIVGGVLLIAAAIIGIVVLLVNGSDTNQPTAEATPLPVAPTAAPQSTEPEPPTPNLEVVVTATLVPFEYTVQEGETLLYVIQLFGYRDTSVIPDILALNGLPSENSIQVGQTLLIPQPSPTPGPSLTPTLEVTATPTPEGFLETQQALIEQGILPTETPLPAECTFDSRCITDDGQYYRHIVSAGETAAGIAFQYDTRFTDFIEVNNLSASNPILLVGQELLVPILITPTPTLTPTGGPNSTATPTPTPAAPSLLAPVNTSTIPRTERPVLQWVTIDPLHSGQAYLVEIRNAASNEVLVRDTTRSNIYRVPDELRPGNRIGGTASFNWQVLVVSSSNPDSEVVSGTGEVWSFTWGG